MNAAINASILVFLSTTFWLWYLRRLDFSPNRLLKSSVVAVGLGATLSHWALDLLYNLTPVPNPSPLSWGQLFVNYVVRAGLLEETVKILPALLMFRTFKTNWDGLLFGSYCALGFAAGENFGYLYDGGEGVTLGRFFLCPIGHIVISALWASHILDSAPRLSGAFIVSALAHGTYNTLVRLSPALGFLLVYLLFVAFLRRTKVLKRNAFAPGPGTDTCSYCHSQTETGSLYCSSCGTPRRASGEHREVRDRAGYAIVVLSLLFVATHQTGGRFGRDADLRERAAELARNGRLEESESLLRQGLQNSPDDTRMAHYLVIALMKQKKWSQARPILEELVNSEEQSWTELHDPRELNARKVSLLNLADVQFRLGEPERALITLETLLTEQIPPDFRAETLALRAEIFYQEGKYEKALLDIDQALNLAPGEVETNKFLKVLTDSPHQETARTASEIANKRAAKQ